MKPQAKRIFRRCPHENKHFESCSECRMYEYCLWKKEMLIHKRRREKQQKLVLKLMMWTLILLLVAGVVYLFMSLTLSEAEKENEQVQTLDNSEFTEEPTVLKAILSADGPSEVYYYEVSEEEKIMMAKLVWKEARGESYEGKVAVAAVVLNRYRFDENKWDFDNDSISSVILQKRQFASISNVTEQDYLVDYPDCMQAVEDACKGWDPTRAVFEDGALYFYAPKLVKGEQKEIREGIKFMAIGNHNFHYDFEKVKE